MISESLAASLRPFFGPEAIAGLAKRIQIGPLLMGDCTIARQSIRKDAYVDAESLSPRREPIPSRPRTSHEAEVHA